MCETDRVICQRMCLICTVIRRNAASPIEMDLAKALSTNTSIVLNELKIGSEGSLHLHCLELYTKGRMLIQADESIFATTTGSTAYNLSTGGPLLHPSLPNIVFNTISPHTVLSFDIFATGYPFDSHCTQG